MVTPANWHRVGWGWFVVPLVTDLPGQAAPTWLDHLKVSKKARSRLANRLELAESGAPSTPHPLNLMMRNPVEIALLLPHVLPPLP